MQLSLGRVLVSDRTVQCNETPGCGQGLGDTTTTAPPLPLSANDAEFDITTHDYSASVIKAINFIEIFHTHFTPTYVKEYSESRSYGRLE